MIDLSPEFAYKAMVRFLDKYYQRTKLDDLGSLLSDIYVVWEDSNPPDPCALNDWKKVTKGKKNLSERECFAAMIEFIKLWENEFKYDFSQLINDLENRYDEKAKDWKDSLAEARELSHKSKSE